MFYSIKTLFSDFDILFGKVSAIEMGDDERNLLRKKTLLKLIFQIVLSSILLILALYFLVINASSSPEAKNLAYAIIGSLLGYWLR